MRWATATRFRGYDAVDAWGPASWKASADAREQNAQKHDEIAKAHRSIVAGPMRMSTPAHRMAAQAHEVAARMWRSSNYVSYPESKTNHATSMTEMARAIDKETKDAVDLEGHADRTAQGEVMHGIHRHAVRDAAVADAKRNDPTRTFSLRAKMRAEGDRRWQTLAQVLRSALIEHDIIGQRGMSKLPFGDKTEGFSMWLREELRQKVFGHDGRWLKPYVQQAAGMAQTRADEMLGVRDANPNDDPQTGQFASGGGTGAGRQTITTSSNGCASNVVESTSA